VNTLNFRILGSLEVSRDGVPVALRGNTLRAVLAGLLVSANQQVSAVSLMAFAWSEHPPVNCRASLYNLISRLRRVLGENSIGTYDAGYLMHADSSRHDLLRFEELRTTATAAAAAGDDERALAALDEAAELWRQPLLSNVESPVLHRDVVPGLAERHLSFQEERIETALRLGRRVAIEDILPLARANPFRERLVGDLMLALFLDGRQADALQEHRRLCEALRAELGIVPGPAIQSLHIQILRGASNLDGNRAVRNWHTLQHRSFIRMRSDDGPPAAARLFAFPPPVS
jgi:DNA-binding SARP family transcriptional activator